MIKMSLSRFKVIVKNVQCLKCENVTLSGFKMRFSPSLSLEQEMPNLSYNILLVN